MLSWKPAQNTQNSIPNLEKLSHDSLKKKSLEILGSSNQPKFANPYALKMWNLVVNQGKCSQKFELLRVCSSAQCVCVCVCERVRERERERIQVDVEDGERLAELQGTKAQYSVCVCVRERERELSLTTVKC